MSVELTPMGTRGFEMPRLPRLMLKPMFGLLVIIFHLFGNRMRVLGAPLLLLTTVGARSGTPRRTVLGWFPDGDDAWLIVASYGGSARHPAWYFNLARHPDEVRIEMRGRSFRVQPESLRGAEREAAWQRIAAQSPGYAAYQQKTDRMIPIVRLKAVREPAPQF